MWQEFSNGVYRAIARVAGAALGSFEFVESVFVRRSVATGEVSLGRSDIDLTIVKFLVEHFSLHILLPPPYALS